MKYTLQPNEVVLLKESSVSHGGIFAANSDELILTNLNLVLAKKGLFGNSKGILTFPIDQIKVHNDQAQALLGKDGRGSPQLEVYFLTGQESFGFQTGGKKKINEWVAKINEIVTGQSAAENLGTGMALPGADYVAGAIKDTFDVFKGRFGSRSKFEPVLKTAGRCNSCGAPISGTSGQLITCEYCRTAQQL